MTSLARETGQTCSYFTASRVCAHRARAKVQKLHEQLRFLYWRGRAPGDQGRNEPAPPGRPARETRKESNVSTIARAIAWPIITLAVIGGTHLVLEAIRPELHEAIGPSVVMPIYLVVGGWT